jgi:uncharacterized protein (TIGR03083 family)
MKKILDDLKAEQEALDRFLRGLTEAQWELPTPSEGWSVKDSVSHIAHIDEVAISILRGDNTPLQEALKIGLGFANVGLEKGRSMSGRDVLLWWPWFALPMGARSFATARLMETWAHGLDCFDALQAEPEDTDRLQHIALLAYMARPYVYQANGLEVPQTPPRIELALPSGTPWSQGPENAKDRIRGRASDFCRVAVRRRHWQDTDLVAEGTEAKRFLEITQAYAGPPGPGRKPKKARD